MSVLTAARVTQEVHTAEFTWGFADTMLDTAGVSRDFGAADTAMAFDIINLPINARVIGGGLVIREAFDTASYAIIIGDSVDTDRYLATADRKALTSAAVALLVPGYKNTGGLKVRMTIANADACTTGIGLVYIQYVIEGSAFRVQPH